jgi:hypothetical protein
MNPQTYDQGYHNVLHGQGYRTPRGAVIDEYGAMVEWWLAGENRRAQRKTCCSATSSTTNLTWSHSGLDPGLGSIVIVAVGWDCVSVELWPLMAPLSISQNAHEWIWGSGGMIFTWENRMTRRKTCPIATLPTTNTTWTNLGKNSGLRGEKPASSCLSDGTVIWQF